jgi:hypothetical protein
VIADQLTRVLAEQVMHWGVAPDRFLVGKRSWIPRWRFQPTKSLEDAFRLLEAADPSEYSIARQDGVLTVRVLIGGTVGEARDASKPRAITYAVARAIGLDPLRCPLPKTGADCQ